MIKKKGTMMVTKSQKNINPDKTRNIAIIGAGQAGLQLSCGLLKNGYNVQLFSNRTAEQVYNGRILSSQAVFNTALKTERELKLNFWDKECPKNVSISLAVTGPDFQSKLIEWTGMMQHPYQSIDQRLKFAAWMNHFEQRGGKLTIKDVRTDELNKIAETHDLTIVAAGKGEISGIFSKDESRSTFYRPQRVVACLYLLNVKPVRKNPGSRVCIVPGIGEYFSTPGLTHNETCEIIQFGGILNGPFDCWHDLSSPEDYLERAMSLLKKYVPWEAERCSGAQLTDNNAVLSASFTPVVKHPVASLACGINVLGLGDTLVLNDPIAAQGANGAAKASDIYLKSILMHGNQPFDKNWMQNTFESFWTQHAQWSTLWSNMLLSPPAPHMMQLLKTATHSSFLADKLADGFDKPSTLFPWVANRIESEKMIKSFSEIDITG